MKFADLIRRTTPLIRNSIRDGYSADYVALLEDWGRWASSRAGGPQGYAGAPSGEDPRFIDDASAMQIELALGRLKKDRPRLFLVFLWHYKSRLDTEDIEAKARHYGWGWDVRLNRYHCQYAAVEHMLRDAEKQVLDTLTNFERIIWIF